MRRTDIMMKQKCPCCGFYTFENKPEGNYDICPVCFQEDDPLAYDDPDEEFYCNQVSINEAIRNYAEFGVCKKDCLKNIRQSLENKKTGMD